MVSLLAASGATAAADDGYKLPWDRTETWQITQGRHGDAFDLDIFGGPADPEVLAIAAGTATLVCEDRTGQATVRLVVTGTGDPFRYLHLSTASVRAAGITGSGTAVSQGQVLGRLMPSPPTTREVCGYSEDGGSHLHLEMPRVPITIEGVTFSDSGPPVLTLLDSSNVRCTATTCAGSSPERVGFLTAGGTAWVKEGRLDGRWVKVAGPGVVELQLEGDRIGARHGSGALYAKDGPLDARWVRLTGSAASFEMEGDRVAFTTRTSNKLFVKDGRLDAGWVHVSSGGVDYDLEGDRIGVLHGSGALYAKDGPLDARWVRLTGSAASFQLSPR